MQSGFNRTGAMRAGIARAASATLFTAAAFSLVIAAPAVFAQTYSNITQSQSGWGNSQSISIGNSDAKPAPKKETKGKKISSTQTDPDTGNTQSANVSGKALVRQNQEGRDNTQRADVDGSGNIVQNQSGRFNSQSISIGGGANVGGTPSLTQSQTGVNRKQSIVIDGKKVETREQ